MNKNFIRIKDSWLGGNLINNEELFFNIFQDFFKRLKLQIYIYFNIKELRLFGTDNLILKEFKLKCGKLAFLNQNSQRI